MSAATSLYESLGALSLPEAATGETTLTSLDPARDILLDLLAAALNAELLARWLDANEGTALANANVVQTKVPRPPSLQDLRSVKTDFPALFVYRSEEPARVDEVTLAQERVVQRWGIDLVLAPTDAGDQRKLRDVLTAAAKVIVLTIERGGHKAYRQAANGTAEIVLLGGGAGFSRVTVADFRLGQASFAQRGDPAGPLYHALSLALETWERSAQTDADPYLSGPFFSLGTGNADGLIPGIVEIDADVPQQ